MTPEATFTCTLCGNEFTGDLLSGASCGCVASKLARAEELESYAAERARSIEEMRRLIATAEEQRAKLIRRAHQLRHEVDPNYDRPPDMIELQRQMDDQGYLTLGDGTVCLVRELSKLSPGEQAFLTAE